jgi:hypothetical protein
MSDERRYSSGAGGGWKSRTRNRQIWQMLLSKAMVQKGCSGNDVGDDYKLHSMEDEKKMTMDRKMSSGNSNKLLETLLCVYMVHNFDMQCNTSLSKMDRSWWWLYTAETCREEEADWLISCVKDGNVWNRRTIKRVGTAVIWHFTYH